MTAETCDKAPEGWVCSREMGHDGPCAAWAVGADASLPARLVEARLNPPDRVSSVTDRMYGWEVAFQTVRDVLAMPEAPRGIKTEAKPKPCPFCGGTRIVVTKVERGAGYDDYPDDPDRWAYYCFCTSCAASGNWSKSSPESAVHWWNMRGGEFA